jgi:hypothetical protein
MCEYIRSSPDDDGVDTAAGLSRSSRSHTGTFRVTRTSRARTLTSRGRTDRRCTPSPIRSATRSRSSQSIYLLTRNERVCFPHRFKTSTFCRSGLLVALLVCLLSTVLVYPCLPNTIVSLINSCAFISKYTYNKQHAYSRRVQREKNWATPARE